MKIDFSHTRVPHESYEQAFGALESYRSRLKDLSFQNDYQTPESFVYLPDDKGLIESVQALAHEKGEGLAHIVVVGIGGSSLGTRAIYDALNRDNRPAMHFIETVDEPSLQRLSSLFAELNSPQEVLVCVVSKSGQTTETVANADIVRAALLQQFADSTNERFVVISNEGSPLAQIAEEQGMSFLAVPHSIGGRYSVLSAVGLFPLACAGVDITSLREGARSMREACLNEQDSPALRGAVTLTHYIREGYALHDLFIFAPELEMLGGWYRQLLAESIGKRENREGEEVRTGITPTVSIGSRDLHSVGQLVLGGPQNRLITTFVERADEHTDMTVHSEGVFSRVVDVLPGKTAATVLSALARSARVAYERAELPFMRAVFQGVTERELGAFIMWKMIETAYLGELLHINAFDQPEVEAYKNAAREILLENNNEHNE